MFDSLRKNIQTLKSKIIPKKPSLEEKIIQNKRLINYLK